MQESYWRIKVAHYLILCQWLSGICYDCDETLVLWRRRSRCLTVILLRISGVSRWTREHINCLENCWLKCCKVPLTSVDDEFYGGKPRPLHLTPTERHRFTWSYYQVWSLLLLDQPSRQQRYRSMLLKHMYLIYEMVDLDQPIGDEPGSSQADEKRCALFQEVSEYLQFLYHDIHGVDYIDFSGQSVSMRTRGHAAIWDHCQPDLKRIVCYQWRNSEKKPVKEEDVWEHTTDEEWTYFYIYWLDDIAGAVKQWLNCRY